MNQEYQAVLFDPPRVGAHGGGGRFCVVSAKTGEVLDDAQGYGYKTQQKAYAAWKYKLMAGDMRC